MGFLTENGPFRPNADGKTLSLNPYSWNNFSNIIYIEGAHPELTTHVRTHARTRSPVFPPRDSPGWRWLLVLGRPGRLLHQRLADWCAPTFIYLYIFLLYIYILMTCAYVTLYMLPVSQTTASDNYRFLEGWFQLFPQFKRNDFYVTGESYGCDRSTHSRPFRA